MESELIVGGIGLLTTIATAWASWFFTKRKYYSEVDHNLIENMENSLEFYKKLSDDNKARLDVALARTKELEEEVKDLKKQVLDLTMDICRDLTSRSRKEKKIINTTKNGKSGSRLSETKNPD